MKMKYLTKRLKENHDINEKRKTSKFWIKEATFDKPTEAET